MKGVWENLFDKLRSEIRLLATVLHLRICVKRN
jgi:hypothetical protein